MEVQKLYPQFNGNDRRQQNVPVDTDRRTNMDRRKHSDNKVIVAERRMDSRLKQDIAEVKDVFKKFKPDDEDAATSFAKELEVGAATTIPYVRRLSGVNDAINQHDYIKAFGTAALLFLNVKEDWRDILKVFKKPNIPHDYQIPFSFTRGTPLEKYKTIRKFDKTLENTNVGNKLLRLIGVKGYEYTIDNSVVKNGLPLVAFKAEGNFIARTIARAAMRIPVLSLIFLSLLELPAVIKSENPVKQTIKSAITVSSIIAGGALIGAIGAASFGPLGSLTGIGIGSFYASKIAKKINSHI